MKGNIERMIRWNRKKGIRRRAAAWASVIMLLFTMFSFDTVGFAQESEDTYCVLKEHLHDQACYDGDELICGLPEHVHTADCLITPESEGTRAGSEIIQARPVDFARELPEIDLDAIALEARPDSQAAAAADAPETAADAFEKDLPETSEMMDLDGEDGDEPEATEAAEPSDDGETLSDAADSADESVNEPDTASDADGSAIEISRPEEDGNEAAEDEGKDALEAPEKSDENVETEAESEDTDVPETDVKSDEDGDIGDDIGDAGASAEPDSDEVIAENDAPDADDESTQGASKIEYPAQAFEARAMNVKVSVQAPEGAFPAGTIMAINRVWDRDTLSDIRETVAEDFVAVKRVTAVDITFYDAEGREIEPLVPIEVAIAVAELKAEQSAVVVHVDDAGNAEVVEQTESAVEDANITELTVEMPAGESEVGFEADEFSIYAVVVTEILETRYIAADGETYNIKVTYGPEAGIPAGASLVVSEVADGAYLPQAEAALPEGERIGMARFFDISIVADGREIEPAAPVEVSVTLDEYAEGQVRAVHFADDGAVDLIEANQGETGVVFSAGSFSVYGVVFTVDFEYEGYTYKLEGGEAMRLSALLHLLDADVDAADVRDVEFSDPTLVRVDAAGDGDWLLTSLKPFRSKETLTVTHAGGVIEITVTDGQEFSIAHLLTGVEIFREDGNTSIGDSDSGNPVKIRTESTYQIALSFAERPNIDSQFSDDDTVMYFDLPESVELLGFENGAPQYLSIDLGEGKSLDNNEVTYETVTVDGKTVGRVRIKWNVADKKNFDLMTESAYAEFTLKYKGRITEIKDELAFSDAVTLSITADDSYTAHVKKEGVYDKTRNQVIYSVDVWSDGKAEKLSVHDEITGTALTLEPGTINIHFEPEEKDGVSYTNIQPSIKGNTFDLVIPELADGQHAKITYSASLPENYEGVTGMGAQGETENTVSVKGTDNDETATCSMAGKIKYVDITKEKGNYTEKDGKFLVPWTITYNADPVVSVAGQTLTDTITSGAVDAMIFDLTQPFTVTVTDSRGNLVEEISKPNWEGVDVTHYKQEYDEGAVIAKGEEWAWTVPSEDQYNANEAFVGPYTYVIQYYTLVNKDHILMGDFSIGNTVTESKTGNAATAHFSGTVQKDLEVKVEKKPLEVTSDYIKWEVKFPRWTDALEGVYLTDYHPVSGDGKVYEPIATAGNRPDGFPIAAEDLFSTQGLMNGSDERGAWKEVMEIVYSGDDRTIFHFASLYENSGDDPLRFNGLEARKDAANPDFGATKNITITYYTLNSGDWIAKSLEGADSNYPAEHTNKVVLQSKGQTAEAEAAAVPPGFKKARVETPVATLKQTSGGKEYDLPVYKFTLKLLGIGADTEDRSDKWFEEVTLPDGSAKDAIVITDSLDKNLRLLTAEEVAMLNLIPQASGNLLYANGGGTIDVVRRDGDPGERAREYTFYVPKDSFRDQYDNLYELPYYVTYNSPEDAKALASELLKTPEADRKDMDTTRSFSNTAKVDYAPELGGSEAKIEVDLKPLSKTAEQIGTSHKFTYKLEINPLCLRMNGGNTYRLTDTFENLAVDFSTMTITPSNAVKWTYHGNEGTFWIPDETAVTIEYEAWPVGESGSVTMTNTAEIQGFVASHNTETDLSSSHSGSIRIYKLQLLKYGDDDMSNRLESVRFKLYHLNSDGKLQAMTYKHGDSETPLGDNATLAHHAVGDPVIFETDENGMASISLNMRRDGVALQPGKQYYLRELGAPDGYTMEDIYWSFVISDMSDYTAYVYRTNDVLKISNSSEGGALIVSKKFAGANLPYSLTKDIQFKIEGFDGEDHKIFERIVKYSDFNKYNVMQEGEGGTVLPTGESYYRYRLPWSTSDIANAVSFTITELKSSADFDTFTRVTTINGASVAEGEEGPSVTVSKSAGADVEEIFTNAYTPADLSLTISKAWDFGSETKHGQEAVFQLYQNGEVYKKEDGTDYTVALSEANGWSETVGGLPRYDEQGNAYTWSVEEIRARYDGVNVETAADVAERFTVTAMTGDTDEAGALKTAAKREGTRFVVDLPRIERGTAGGTAPGAIQFTNALNNLVTVKVKKVWKDNAGDFNEVHFDLYRTTEELPEEKTAENLLALDGKELVRADEALTKDAGGQWSEYSNAMMEKYDNVGKEYHYFAIERSVAGYAAAYGIVEDKTNKTQEITVTNSKLNDKKGTLSVKKAASGNPDSGTVFHFTVTNSGMWLNQDGQLQNTEYIHDINADEALTFENVTPGAYVVREVQPDVPEGYSLTVSIDATVGEDDQTATTTGGASAEIGVESDKTTHVTINNTYVQGQTDFTFGKLWVGPDSQTASRVWPLGKEIRVTIKRRTGDDSTDPLELTYRIKRESSNVLTATFDRANSRFSAGISLAPNLEILDAGRNHQYKFRLSGLPEMKDETQAWEYYAVEAETEGFDTHYGIVDGFNAIIHQDWNDAHTGYNEVLNKPIVGNIINKMKTYTLDIPVKKVLSGRGAKDSDLFAVKLSYTDKDGALREEEAVIAAGDTHTFTVPVNVEDLQLMSVDGTLCVVGTIQYTVTEIVPEEDQKILGVSYLDKPIAVTESLIINWATGEIVSRVINAGSKNGVQVIEVANTYRQENWALTIHKTWNDDSNRDGKRGKLTFNVDCYDAEDNKLNGNPLSFERSMGVGESSNDYDTTVSVPKFINSVLVTKYVVSEVQLARYDKPVLTGNIITIDAYDKTAAALPEDKAVSVTNSHEPELVNVAITKVWNDNDRTDLRQPVEMTLYANYSGQEHAFNTIKADWPAEYQVEGTITLNGQEQPTAWRHVWQNLPKYVPGMVGVPVTYAVKETTATLPLGYYQSAHYDAPTPDAPATRGTAENTITNTFSTVDITATKVWNDDENRDGLREEISLRLSATVNGSDVKAEIGNAGYDIADKTVGTDGGSVKWAGLPERDRDGAKITYTVAEVTVPAGYTSSVANTGSAFTVTNTHDYDKTQIVFTKTWAGDNHNQDGLRPGLRAYLDKLELKMGSVALKPGAEIQSDNNSLKLSLTTTATGVSNTDQAAIGAAWVEITGNGDTYTVTYGNLPKYSGGDTIAYALTEGTVDCYKTASGSGEVTLTNYAGALTNIRKTADLVISKALVSDLAADRDEVFTFTIAASPKISDSYAIDGASDTVQFDSKGKAEVRLKGGESIKLLGLPTGITYTVTEASDDRFTTLANDETGSACVLTVGKDDEKTFTAAFTNTRKTGDLVITKTVSRPADGDLDHEFMFRVTLSDSTITKAYGGVRFTKGVSDIIRLKDGGSATLTDLPTDVEYRVDEIDGGDAQEAKYLACFDTTAPASATVAVGKNRADITNTRHFVPLALVKVDANNNSKALAEAEFTLKKDGNNLLKLVSDQNGVLLAQEALSSGVIEAVAGSGELKLAIGTYALEETKAPDGYRRLSGDITITVNENFKISVDKSPQDVTLTVPAPTDLDADTRIATVKVPNLPGADFPATGGRGTLPYYVAGFGLLAFGLCLLLFKRRRA